MITVKDIIKNSIREPITFIIFGSFVMYSVGILWGLPHSETWLSDSLAPYHPLIGLSKGFSYGYYQKYPLVHQLLLAILNIPVLVAALVNSNPLEGLQIFKFVLLIQTPPYATALILIDRTVSLLMALGLIYSIYLSADELFGKRAALLAALFVAINPIINFYAHVAKVEVPYLFWASLAIYYCIKMIKVDSKKYYAFFALFTVLSFGTKDQGYAIFILPIIIYIIIFPLLKDKKTSLKAYFVNSRRMTFAAVFIISMVLVENVLFNLDGLILRFRALTGWNMIRSVSYTKDISGVCALLSDSFGAVNYMTGPLILMMSLGGVALAIYNNKNHLIRLISALIFFVAAVSYYIFFVQVVRQSSYRQLLPVAVFMAPYAGYLLSVVANRFKFHRFVYLLCILIIIVSPFYNSLSTNNDMLNDLRYEVEDWMKINIPENSKIEYYAYLHYLPRFPEKTLPYRVKKYPMEIEKRKPDFIVISSHYYPRFLVKVPNNSAGRIAVTKKNQKFLESDFNIFFDKLFKNELHYSIIKSFNRKKSFFKQVPHARVSPENIIIFKRM